MKNILFILLLISFTDAHAKNFCDTYLGTEVNPDLDQTDQYISYMGKLYDEGVLSAQDLNDMIVESNKANQLINPLAKATHSASSRLAHFENLAWYLKNTPIDKKKVLDWAQKVQAEVKANIVRKQKAQEQTIETYQKMIFYPVSAKTHTFEMMSTKVTQKMWMDLMGKNPSFNKGNGIKPNHPVESISWWSAAEFANRLSIQHGLQPAYALDKIKDWDGSAEDGTLTPLNPLAAILTLQATYPNKDIRKLEGYRLPTEEESDRVRVGGATGLRPLFPGVTPDNVQEYGWFDSSTIAVGQLTAFIIDGHEFFDLYGNTWEYANSWTAFELRDQKEVYTLRPKAFGNPPPGMLAKLWAQMMGPRAAMVIEVEQNKTVGFRLVRTLPIKSP